MFELRPYQVPIADIVFRYMRNNPGKHPLVALPTGSGKTVVLADVIQKSITRWPGTKILILSHVKEILSQNYKAITTHTGLEVGINSAGMGLRQVSQVTVAGIQSVHRHSELFKDFNLIIIDECHLIPDKDQSMYRKFFAGLDKPRYFGLTATPFRLGSGLIYGEKDSIFNDLVYDLTSSNKFVKLIEDGYLCNLRTQATETELDVKGVRIKGGDFDQKDLSEHVNIRSITRSACREIIKHGAQRKKWLIFAIDIEHAESIAETLIEFGVPSMVVHSKMEFDRDFIIQSYRDGAFKAMVNVNVLTTGFDDPEIDLVAILRPTKSPVIHVQTIGRGLRIAPGKAYCLVLDFAGNTERLGPINDIHISRKVKGESDEKGEPLTRICDQCDAILPIKTKVCPWCGYEFPVSTKLGTRATNAEVIKTKKDIDWYDVKEAVYNRHTSNNKPEMVKVSYFCGTRYFNEYICIEHTGYAKKLADHWVQFRGGEATNVNELIDESKNLKVPKRIKIDTRGKYPTVVDAEFGA